MKGKSVKIEDSNMRDKNGKLEEQSEQETDTQEEEEIKKKKHQVDETMRTIEISGLTAFSQAQSKAAKIFWLILLIASTSILIWQMYKTIDNYINGPIVSTYTITTAPEMAFPIVILCPTTLAQSDYLNKTPTAEKDALEMQEDVGIVWDYVKFLAAGNLSNPFQLTKTDLESHLVPTGFRGMTKVKQKRSNTTMADAFPFRQSTKNEHRDPEAFFLNATATLEDHVKHCEFRQFLWDKIPCRNITREVYDPDYGKCYVIDVGDRRQAVQAQGLLILFHVQTRLFPKQSPLSPIFNGVVVGIENEYNVGQAGERVFVAPGYNRIDLAKQRQEFMTFDTPYVQKCTNQDDFEYELFNVNYTRKSCGFDCVARALKEKCDCLPPADRALYKESVLNETNQFCMGHHLTCIRDKVHGDKIVLDKIEACRSQCNVPCSNSRYSVRASAMDLFPPSFFKWQIVPDFIYILIAYSHMEYTQFTQSASTTPNEFISNIGNEFGLWMGISMMTLIQLPLALATVCGLCCVKKTKKAAVTVKDVRRKSTMQPA